MQIRNIYIHIYLLCVCVGQQPISIAYIYNNIYIYVYSIYYMNMYIISNSADNGIPK